MEIIDIFLLTFLIFVLIMVIAPTLYPEMIEHANKERIEDMRTEGGIITPTSTSN